MEIKFNETIKVEIMERFSKNEIFKVCFSFVSCLGDRGGRGFAERNHHRKAEVGDSLFL